jgi:hypothetical protein
VSVDVEVADRVDDPHVLGDGGLDGGLDEDTDGSFEIDHVFGVAIGDVDPGADQPADPEVQDDGGGDHGHLACDLAGASG